MDIIDTTTHTATPNSTNADTAPHESHPHEPNSYEPNSHEPLTPDNYYARLRTIPIESIARSPEILAARIVGKSGDELLCDCPHHPSSSKKSLNVNVSKNVWHCYGCGIGGDLIQLVEFVFTGHVTHPPKGAPATESHRQARNWIADHFNIPRMDRCLNMTPEQRAAAESAYHEECAIYDVLTRSAEHFHHILTHAPECADALEYLQSHYRFTREFIDKEKIGYAYPLEWMDPTTGEKHPHIHQYFTNTFDSDVSQKTGLFNKNDAGLLTFRFPYRFTFPYWHHGRVRYMIARLTQWTPVKSDADKAKYKKLATHNDQYPYVSPIIKNDLLHNEECLDNQNPAMLARPIIITEGITDNLAAMQAGFLAISPVTTRIPDADMPRVIRKLKGRTVIICLDNELSMAGNNNAESLADKLEHNGITARIIELPRDQAQIDALQRLKDEFGWDASPNTTTDTTSGIARDAAKKRLQMFREQLANNPDPDQLTLFNSLVESAKQDLNSWFTTHTPENFQSLIDSAPTRIERTLSLYSDRVTAGDAKLLSDQQFVDTLALAEKRDPTLFHDTWESIPRSMRKLLTKQMKSAQRKATIHAIRSADVQSPEVHTLLSVALSPFKISLPTDVIKITSDIGKPLFLPHPYIINQSGIIRLSRSTDGTEQLPISPSILFVSSYDVDIATDETYVSIHYYYRNKWEKITVARDVARNARKCVDLAKYIGFPVASHNCNELARFLSDFEKVNEDNLPKRMISSQLGMVRVTAGQSAKQSSEQTSGQPSFLLGGIHLTPSLQSSTSPLSPPSPVSFRGDGAGNDQIAASFHSHGDLSKWLGAIQPVWHYDRLRLAIYASLSAPLLSILDAPNYGVDFSNRTSTGKTTILRAAASIWGCPDETAKHTLLQSWDATPIFVEQACATANDLPLFLDDTKRARTKDIDRIAYTVINGHGRSRGALRGTRPTFNWRTVLLSTGESPLIDHTPSGGVRARILSIEGLPFLRDDKTTKPVVDRLNRTIRRNYGHIGPLFVQYLLGLHQSWPDIITRYDKLCDHYAELTDTGATGRLGDMAALIDLTGQLFAEMMNDPAYEHLFCVESVNNDSGVTLNDSENDSVDNVSNNDSIDSVSTPTPSTNHTTTTTLPVTLPYSPPFRTLWLDLSSAFTEIDIHVRALHAAYEWAVSNQHTFYGRHAPVVRDMLSHDDPARYNSSAPSGSMAWSGKWDESDNYTSIAFTTPGLQRAFRESHIPEHELKGIVNAWKATGYLDAPNKKSYTKPLRIRGVWTRLIVIKRDAIEQIIELAEPTNRVDLGDF